VKCTAVPLVAVVQLQQMPLEPPYSFTHIKMFVIRVSSLNFCHCHVFCFRRGTRH